MSILCPKEETPIISANVFRCLIHFPLAKLREVEAVESLYSKPEPLATPTDCMEQQYLKLAAMEPVCSSETKSSLLFFPQF